MKSTTALLLDGLSFSLIFASVRLIAASMHFHGSWISAFDWVSVLAVALFWAAWTANLILSVRMAQFLAYALLKVFLAFSIVGLLFGVSP